jgi:hypothetical protein
MFGGAETARLSRGSSGGGLEMTGVALVRCDSADRVIEDGNPCTVLCARLVVPAGNNDAGPGGGGYRVVEWSNQPEGEFPELPPPGATVCLVPHPHGVAPVLIAGDCRLFYVWAGPVLFFFFLYDPGFDASGYLGKVFAIREA